MAIPANIRGLLVLVLATLSPEVLLWILEDRCRGTGHSRIQQAIRLQNVLVRANNCLNDLLTQGNRGPLEEQIQVAQKEVADARQLLLNFLEERALPEEPLSQVETSTKTTLY